MPVLQISYPVLRSQEGTAKDRLEDHSGHLFCLDTRRTNVLEVRWFFKLVLWLLAKFNVRRSHTWMTTPSLTLTLKACLMTFVGSYPTVLKHVRLVVDTRGNYLVSNPRHRTAMPGRNSIDWEVAS